MSAKRSTCPVCGVPKVLRSDAGSLRCIRGCDPTRVATVLRSPLQAWRHRDVDVTYLKPTKEHP